MATRTKDATRTFKTANDLPEDVRTKSIGLLNQQLADTLDLYSQTKQAHWNVKGPNFYQLHLLFDAHAAHVVEWIDQIAERAVMLGGYATGTARMAAANSTLPEYPTDAVEGMDHVKALVERWGTYAASTREGIDTTEEWGDADTSDMLTEISRQTDMDLWFLEAHLQG
jgi:starvation-inducible DNA-binding protein